MGFLFQIAICSCRSETKAGILLAVPGHVFSRLMRCVRLSLVRNVFT